MDTPCKARSTNSPEDSSDESRGWRKLYEEARLASDCDRFLQLTRRRKRLLKQGDPPHTKSVRMAVLGGATTETLLAPIQLSIECRGLGCCLYEAEHNTYASEMIDPSTALLEFKPEVTLVSATPFSLPTWPQPFDDVATAQELAGEVAQYWLGLCRQYHEKTGNEIILDNFHMMPHTSFGNLGTKLPGDVNNFLARVNLQLGDSAPSYVHINDVASLAAYFGVRNWHDARYWYHAKQPVSFECLIPYVRNISGIVGSLYGKMLKCLVLDLDNTLWGGVVGDDGVEGILIGQGDAVGEAFKSFQTYLAGLKERGILLAVSSKNDMEIAMAPFERHPEMVLRRDDLVSFKANWNPKPDNIRAIAAELNIGLDAIGFVDDNPAEREIVRQWTPEVTVFEMTEDPAQYPRILQDSGALEAASLSREDQTRTAAYQHNAQRQQLVHSTGDYDDYLHSLQQLAVVDGISETYLDRVTQLVNKSNQFNLTTLRKSRSQIEALLSDDAVASFTIRLSDRFGDNGLICVCWGHQEQDVFHIDQWLMSCRVLKRGVEKLLCNQIVKRCRSEGFQLVQGTYIPTPKNKMVEDLYSTLGFSLRQQQEDGKTTWTLDTKKFEPFDVAIQIVDHY